MSETTALAIENRNGFTLVRLNRPEVKNAIDQTMVDELHSLCEELERHPRILIIAGTEGIFASGADIAQLKERRREDALRGINSTIFDRIAHLPAPVIAAVDGYALGGGLELALAADFRLSTPSAKFGQPEANLGIIAGAGALWRLADCVGRPLAKEILLAGRILSGEEAQAAHLITELHPAAELEAAAVAFAERILRLDPLAVRISKALMDVPRGAHPVVDTIAQAVLFESPEKFDRMQAFLDRKNEA